MAEVILDHVVVDDAFVIDESVETTVDEQLVGLVRAGVEPDLDEQHLQRRIAGAHVRLVREAGSVIA